MLDRRGVLRAGAYASAAGLVTALTGHDNAGAAPHGPSAPTPQPAVNPNWQQLEKALQSGSKLYLPKAQNFPALARPWNLRYEDRKPMGIVSCASAQDVRTALLWAKENGMPLAPRAGGHNYAGYSTTTGLLISVRPMSQVTALDGNRLRIGGGATNGDVAKAGAGAGGTNLYVPGGRCVGVGIAGLTLGGGLGFNDRKWGLTCDNLVETEIVLADGSIVRANRDTEADLFWACRGGAGGNFGINTSFLFDAVDVSRRTATVFHFTFGPGSGEEIMKIVQEMLADDRGNDLDIRIEFENPGTGPHDVNVAVLGQYLGGDSAVRRRLDPLLRLRPAEQSIEQLGFWTAQEKLSMVSEHETVASKSLVPHTWLPSTTVKEIVDWTLKWKPYRRGNSGYVTLFAMGGKAGAPSADATAFPHRDGKFVIDVGTSWTDGTTHDEVQRLLAQTRGIHGRLSEVLKTNAAYVNFPDPDLTDWQTAYYGSNYGRLRKIKTRNDPHRIFRYGQGIEPLDHSEAGS
ncbi:FAD-binding oxidoreductase [Actinomadura sp. 7K507]|uniref:FAD-binding oxidoreductase n=1 Tax=Actinomadura sp. 7K507 TaxID=2530365 RepID=UPI0010461C8F|nr:FAD-binding oxidoreductase [Actinomadura sp. 7K507]TDC98076.1 FAD-binding oxidoreductase [Actinomadura sp. 7K507]